MIGGVLGVLVLSFVVGIVISTIAMVVRLVVIAALIWGAFRLWAIFSRD